MVDPDKVTAILALLEQGSSLNAAAKEVGIPESNFRFWMKQDEELAAKYARARAIGYETHADAIIGIADNAEDPNKARVQIDARKWILSKMLPKVYGDKVSLEHSGKVTTVHQVDDDELAAIATGSRARVAVEATGAEEPAGLHALHQPTLRIG